MRPNLIVTSPVPPSLAQDLLSVQAEMMNEYPSLKTFAVPHECLHITHLALKCEGSSSDLFKDALTEMLTRQYEIREEKYSVPAITVAIGAQRAFNGNICVEVAGAHLKIIGESVQQECRTRGIWFDEVQDHNFLMFQ